MKIKNKQNGEIYTVHKYVLSNDGIESVWCNDWYGHHRIGFDCEWVTAYDFIRGIGWQDKVTNKEFTTAQLYKQYKQEK